MEGLTHRQKAPPFHLLQVGVWSAISSYADAADAGCDERNPSSVSALRCASRAFRALLTSESYYQARVADAICELSETDRRGSSVGEKDNSNAAESARSFQEAATRYPSPESVGGNRNLLRIIAEYGPLRGWYKLRGSCDWWPWEFLVRMAFSDGKLCGDVVSVTGSGTWEGANLRPITAAKGPVLEISFEKNGKRRCQVIGKTAEGFCFKAKTGGGPRPCESSGGVTVGCRPRDFYRSQQARPPSPGGGRDEGPTLQVYDVLKDSTSITLPPHVPTPASSKSTENNSPRFIPNARAPATRRRPEAMIELMLEHDIPLCGRRSTFRRSPSTDRFESYYPNELHFEHLCGPGGAPPAIGGG